MEFDLSANISKTLEARCRGDAEHCERVAAIMLTKGLRESYLELAVQWRKLANEAGAHRLRVEAWSRRTARTPVDPSLAAEAPRAGAA